MGLAFGSVSNVRSSFRLSLRSSFRSSLVFFAAASALTASGACKKSSSEDDNSQVGQSVGESMASMDESSQGSMTALLDRPPLWRTPDQLRGPLWRRAMDQVMPSAYGASCWGALLSVCTAGTRTRAFDNCLLGPSTLDGTVTLDFNGSTPLCVVATTGDNVTRTASFTLTGPYGGTLAVTSPGGGQTLTKTATGFTYAVGGIERILTAANGTTVFDVSTTTTTPLVITGTSRADLTIVSGTFMITNHTAGYSVSLVPSNLAWTASCNCAVSGTLVGTVSGGHLDGKSASVMLTGCGTADVAIDGVMDNVVLDRCAAI
jgi:hypothetical protein